MEHLAIDAWLRGRRAERDLTRLEMATQLGVSERLLAAWERRELVPNKVVHLSSIAAWGGLEASDVLSMVLRSVPEAEAKAG